MHDAHLESGKDLLRLLLLLLDLLQRLLAHTLPLLSMRDLLPQADRVRILAVDLLLQRRTLPLELDLLARDDRLLLLLLLEGVLDLGHARALGVDIPLSHIELEP